MNFRYIYGKYPKNNPARHAIRLAAERLFNRLATLNLAQLDISDYNKRYVGEHIETFELLHGHLTKYSYILQWALSGIDKKIEDIVLLDYGGGHGMLSLLAKETGIGTVIHNDIYPVSCQDAKKIGHAIDLKGDHFIPGNIEDVISYFKSNKIQCDVVANYDVIEHIYDIDNFLDKLGHLSDGPMSIFLASGANELNPRIKWILQKQHNEFESKDRPAKFGRKPTDTTRSIFDVRRDIIVKHAPELPSDKVDRIAELSRGMIEPAIINAVKNYSAHGVLPPEPDHPTNTCDPYTGNWIEHLMNSQKLADRLKTNGFSAEVQSGYYNASGGLPKRLIKASLNAGISTLGPRLGLRLAPYFALYATR